MNPDEKLDKIIKYLEQFYDCNEIKEAIRIFESLKSENRKKWCDLPSEIVFNDELDKMILRGEQ